MRTWWLFLIIGMFYIGYAVSVDYLTGLRGF